MATTDMAPMDMAPMNMATMDMTIMNMATMNMDGYYADTMDLPVMLVRLEKETELWVQDQTNHSWYPRRTPLL